MARLKAPTSAPALQLAWGGGAVAAIVLLAVVSAWPIYRDPRVVAIGAVGLVVGAATILVGQRLRWSAWVTAAVAGGAYLVTVVPVAVPSAMASPRLVVGGIGDGILGVVVGWKRLLTVSIPAGHYQAVLVPFFLVVLVGTLAAFALLVHAGRWAPVAVVPMVAMVVFGAVFGSSSTGEETTFGGLRVPAPAHVVVGMLTVVVCATWLIGRSQIQRTAALRIARSSAATVRMTPQGVGLTLRRYSLAAMLAAAAIAAGVVAAPIAAYFGPRDVPRDAVDPLLVVQRQPSPLSSYRAWFAADRFDAELFSVSGAAGVDRIRIATMDDYDGEVFHVPGSGPSAVFARQPNPQDATVSITIGPGFSGVWVPVVSAESGAPVFEGDRASALAAAYYGSTSLDAGVLATEDAASGFGLLEGDSYRVSANAPTEPDLSAIGTGAAPLISENDYPSLAAWVDQQGLGRTASDLTELVSRLRERGFLTHAAQQTEATSAWIADLQSRGSYAFQAGRSGHSKARIEELFTSLLDQERRVGSHAQPAMLVAAVGDDEQFATAAALLARYLGFESRVVIGVRLGDASPDAGVQPCTDVCTGANVTAWAEARALGGKWFTLDATPQFTLSPSIVRAGEILPEHATQVDPPKNDVLEPPEAQAENTSSTHEDPNPEHQGGNLALTIITVVLTTALALGLLAAPLLVFPLAKTLRRRWRRTSPVPEVAMVGAWEELIGSYVDHGLGVPRRLTRAETADVLERPAASTLATMVDSAVFAEHPPGRDASARAWEILDAERAQVGAEVSLGARVRALLTPASLFRELPISRVPSVATLLRRKDHP